MSKAFKAIKDNKIITQNAKHKLMMIAEMKEIASLNLGFMRFVNACKMMKGEHQYRCRLICKAWLLLR